MAFDEVRLKLKLKQICYIFGVWRWKRLGSARGGRILAVSEAAIALPLTASFHPIHRALRCIDTITTTTRASVVCRPRCCQVEYVQHVQHERRSSSSRDGRAERRPHGASSIYPAPLTWEATARWSQYGRLVPIGFCRDPTCSPKYQNLSQHHCINEVDAT